MPSIKVRKYGNSVYVIYSHGHRKFKIFTGVKVETEFWNLSNPKKNCPDYNDVIKAIEGMQKRVLDASWEVRNRKQDPTVDLVRAEFYAQITPAEPEIKPFFETYLTFVDLKFVRESTRKKIKISMRVLEYYCSWSGYKPAAATWTQLEFGRFVQYMLLQQKMMDSTIAKHVKDIKHFMVYFFAGKDLSWMKYTNISVDEVVIALSEPELRQLIEAELGGWLETTRDLFVFLATTGMRFSDSQLFNPQWVTEEKILEFTQLKTGGKAYPPLYEASRRILLKYNGIPPQISNQKFNDHLKELFEELKMDRPVTVQTVRGRVVCSEVYPLHSIISSHTARRTFITLCLMKGMPLQDVMKMSGHSDYKSMKPYIRITRQHIRTIADKWEI